MSLSVPRVHEYKDAWRWPEDVERFVRDQIPDGSRVLNCPSGGSRLGDVLVDAEPQFGDVIEGDMFELLDVVEPCSFDVAISDPPWRELDYFDRWKQFFQVVKSVKPGGLVIYNATWEPNSDQCEIVGRYRRSDEPFRQISQITIFRRYPDQRTLTGWSE